MRVNNTQNSPGFGNQKRIFVCSPVTLGIEAVSEVAQKNEIIASNIKKAEDYCRKVMLNGDYPYAPHLIATRFTNEHVPEERKMGINIGLAFLKICDALCVFSKTGKFGKGMEAEMREAAKHKIPVIFVKDGTDAPDQFIRQFGEKESIKIHVLEENELPKIDELIENN